MGLDHRLSDLSAVDSIADEMLQSLEKAETVDSAHDLFVVYDLLPVILTGSNATCEDYVAAAAAPRG